MKQQRSASNRSETGRSGLSRLEKALGIGALIVIVAGGTALLGGQAPGSTATPTPSPRATVAAVIIPTLSPTSPPPSATPPPPTVTLQPASPTAAPVSPSPMPTRLASNATVTSTPYQRYLGRDPLPPGIDLTNGPFLKQLKAEGYPGVNVGDGGLGDQIKAAYEEALQAEARALDELDDSQFDKYFSGDALARMQRIVNRGRTSTEKYTGRVEYHPRVMQFIPKSTLPNAYEIVDARTEIHTTNERLPDGKPGKEVRKSTPQRTCYSIRMIRRDGRWRIDSILPRSDGEEGHKCPPYWS